MQFMELLKIVNSMFLFKMLSNGALKTLISAFTNKIYFKDFLTIRLILPFPFMIYIQSYGRIQDVSTTERLLLVMVKLLMIFHPCGQCKKDLTIVLIQKKEYKISLSLSRWMILKQLSKQTNQIIKLAHSDQCLKLLIW